MKLRVLISFSVPETSETHHAFVFKSEALQLTEDWNF